MTMRQRVPTSLPPLSGLAAPRGMLFAAALGAVAWTVVLGVAWAVWRAL
jgi:hypothetical protein